MSMPDRHFSRAWVTLLLTLGLSVATASHAQTHVVEAQRIIDALKPDPVPAPGLKTRSLRNLQVEQTSEAIDKPSAPKFVSLTIGFKFDSAQITPESASTLSTLAQALNSNELSQLTFMIEGHTDGKGTADYNLRLSQQRAAAVQSFLIQAGVDTKRLQSLGKGDTELVNAQDRFAAENRRVKVIALTK